MAPTTKRAAIYARFSTELQRDRSIEDQVALCQTYAERENLIVARTYSDRARSGASILGRDGLLSLMEDARARAFDVVIVEALDRLSRDQEDLAGLFKRLTFFGVEIRAVHDGTADAIQIGVRGLLSTLFLADLKHKIRRGMTGVVRDGRSAGGKAYGYRPIPGRAGELEIVEDEAAVVRRIYQEFMEGKSTRDIAAGLNADGILPPRGRFWYASAIHGNSARGNGILNNPLYGGRLIWNRVTMVKDPETGKRISRPNPVSEWKETARPDLAIVDPEVWQAVQERKGRPLGSTARPKRARRRGLLSGLLRCGVCGGGMSAHDVQAGRARIRCTVAAESKSCTNTKRFTLDTIEKTVVDGLRDELAHPDVLVEYVRAYHEERKRLAGSNRRERDTLEREIVEIDRKLDALVDALAERRVPMASVEKKIAQLEADKERALAALSKLDETSGAEVVTLHPAAMERYRADLDELHKLLAFGEEAAPEARAKFHEIVESVVVFPTDPVEIEIRGRLAALLAPDEAAPLARVVGGELVAEVRFGTSPPTFAVRKLVLRGGNFTLF